jgi:hypothetical protein
MTERLGADVLGMFRDAREVQIETRPAPDVPPHRTVIWVAVDDEDRAFIRTAYGARSRWYREALAGDTVGIVVDGQRVEVSVELVEDDERIEACSEAYRRKYRTSRGSLQTMLQPEVLPTTLELHPVTAA